MNSFQVKLHRIVSWWLVFFSIATILTGYTISRHWIQDITIIDSLHLIFEWSFIILLIFHVVYTVFFVKIKTLRLIRGIKNRRGTPIHWLRIIQQITKWIILVFTLLTILSGLNRYEWFAIVFQEITPFMWHVNLDGILSITILIHVMAGSKLYLYRKNIKNIWSGILIFMLGGSLIAGTIYLEIPKAIPEAQVIIQGEIYSFNPQNVATSRTDIFNPGYFSVFDILVSLDDEGQISMNYHFNGSLNTNIIDSINGESNWWYYAYYTGGFVESNSYRMDHFMWKNGTVIELFQTSVFFLNSLYSVWEEELDRLSFYNGSVVIPTITIGGESFTSEFNNISIIPHNWRNDTFQYGIITVLDVILTLGELSLINYTTQWYESLGTASIVRSFWVESINNDMTVGRCGFAYEVGNYIFEHKNGNYINVPSDVRVLNSPQYVKFFWHCL